MSAGIDSRKPDIPRTIEIGPSIMAPGTDARPARRHKFLEPRKHARDKYRRNRPGILAPHLPNGRTRIKGSGDLPSSGLSIKPSPIRQMTRVKIKPTNGSIVYFSLLFY